MRPVHGTSFEDVEWRLCVPIHCQITRQGLWRGKLGIETALFLYGFLLLVDLVIVALAGHSPCCSCRVSWSCYRYFMAGCSRQASQGKRKNQIYTF